MKWAWKFFETMETGKRRPTLVVRAICASEAFIERFF